MRDSRVGALVALSVVLLAASGSRSQATAQDSTPAYSRMAPIDQYLMDRTAEVALARSAAPEAISRDASVLVLGRKGYEVAAKGTNGFVCMVDRGWTGPFDWPELWNPRIRAAACLNPQAVQSILPIAYLRTTMTIAGSSQAEIISALKAAFNDNTLAPLESGAMSYMMSPSAYLTDQGGHNGSHVMFYTELGNGADWGANVAGSPVLASPYWFFSPQAESTLKGLPPILVFLVGVPTWSDGTPASQHSE